MPGNKLSLADELTSDDQLWIDRICDEFEQAWRNGSPPSIASYLEKAVNHRRAPLVEALIAVDVEYRRQCGEQPKTENYRILGLNDTLLSSLLSTNSDVIQTPTFVEPPDHTDVIPFAAPTGFRLERRLGKGGMGEVYLAEDTRANRKVAIKFMRSELAADPSAHARFLRESRAAAGLVSDHIIPIFQVGEENGIPFLVMPHLQGQTLADRLRKHPRLSIDEVVRIGRDIAMALATAHDHGIVHRDIKPSNIWLEDLVSDDQGTRSASFSRARLLDFGLAVAEDGDGQLTKSGALLGTPAYMSPEQADQQPVGSKSDLFSLGTVLYECLSGERPFDQPRFTATLRSVVENKPAPIRRRNPNVPAALSDLLAQLHAKQPGHRPDSAHEVAQILNKFCQTDFAMATRRTRWKWAPPIAICAALLLALGAFVLRVSTDRGQLVVETDDERVTALVEKEQVTVRDKQANRSYTLRIGATPLPTGDYELIVADTANNLEFSAKTFKILRGGREIVKATYVPANTNASVSPDRRAAEWAKSIGGTVLIRLVNDQQLTVDEKTKELPTGFQVVEMTLEGRAGVTDAGLKSLNGLKSVASLNLQSCKSITDKSMGLISSMSSIGNLAIGGTGITSESLSRLQQMSKLRCLNVLDLNLRPDDLKTIASLSQLDSLVLGENPVGDKSLKNLEQLKGLVDLYLSCTQMTDEGMSCLGRLTALRILDLSDNGLSGTSLRHLSSLKQLVQLDISNNKTLGNEGLAHLASLKRLQNLALANTGITDDGLKHLGGLPNLTHLNLRSNAITGEGLKYIVGLDRLAFLDLCHTDIESKHLPRLAELKSLVDLRIGENLLTAQDIEAIAALKNLEQLSVEYTQIDNDVIPIFEKMKQLKHIWCIKGTKMTPEGIKKLKELRPDCTIQ